MNDARLKDGVDELELLTKRWKASSGITFSECQQEFEGGVLGGIDIVKMSESFYTPQPEDFMAEVAKELERRVYAISRPRLLATAKPDNWFIGVEVIKFYDDCQE